MRLEATLKDKALFGKNEGQSLKQKCQKMFLKIDQSKIFFLRSCKKQRCAFCDLVDLTFSILFAGGPEICNLPYFIKMGF